MSQTEVDKRVFNYYETDGVHNHYTKLWGPGNIHFGFFPNLLNDSVPAPRYEDAALLLTHRMCDQAHITKNSIVLDLGCGYGKPACDMAIKTGCKVIGIDLSKSHISEANKIVCKLNDSKQYNIDCKFYVGSFSDYPKEIENIKFTHIFTQAAFCHAHSDLSNVLNKASKQLKHNGIIVINDVLSNKKAGNDTKLYVYQRMSFPTLISTNEYTKILKNNGFDVLLTENLNDHLWLSYHILASRAKATNDKQFKELSYKYDKTCQSIAKDEYGMVTIIARKGKLDLSSKL